MYSTDVIAENEGYENQIIEDFLKPLLPEIDLLSFRDNKNNNVLHCALKTFQKKTTNNFFQKIFNKYVPKDMTEDLIKSKLTQLVSTKNNAGIDPFEFAMAIQEPK